jgi:GNAT superfamily N-acetyltransferase
MDLRFLPVNWSAASEQCMAFRRQAWLVSYGTMNGFSESDTMAWLKLLATKHPYSFLHVWHSGQVIGQIEYRAPIIWDDGAAGGYINLLYLVPSHRRQGFGQAMHDYVLADLRTKNCLTARLRYLPSNLGAQRFYTKNGWHADGQADARGQLIRLVLAQTTGLA